MEQFEVGITTQTDVLEMLGPPSQLIKLDDQVVFYYLAQQNKGSGVILIVWLLVQPDLLGRDTDRYRALHGILASCS